MTSDDGSEVGAVLWRQQIAGSLGCGALVVIVPFVIGALLYTFAPVWLFLLVTIPMAVMALILLRSAWNAIRQSRLGLHEASGSWRMGAPKKRSLDEVAAMWTDLEDRYATLLTVCERRISPHLDAFTNLNTFNGFQQRLIELRSLVRREMPTAQPEGRILDLVEEWLSAALETCYELRHQRIQRSSSISVSAAELMEVVKATDPPRDLIASELKSIRFSPDNVI